MCSLCIHSIISRTLCVWMLCYAMLWRYENNLLSDLRENVTVWRQAPFPHLLCCIRSKHTKRQKCRRIVSDSKFMRPWFVHEFCWPSSRLLVHIVRPSNATFPHCICGAFTYCTDILVFKICACVCVFMMAHRWTHRGLKLTTMTPQTHSHRQGKTSKRNLNVRAQQSE